METGLILSRYRPLEELGEGGHGAVDLAFDTKMARRVAIKRIPITHRGLELLERNTGLKEARTAALLNHPNIVTVYEWDTDEDEAFLIMEHVDGASLARIVDTYAPLDRDEAAAVIAAIADAVEYAHSNGVLHLDLKPDNVLVTRDGLVKVGDFGVASLTNAAGQALSAGGTLGYMPPEQLRGMPVDARTDVWAFAVLAYEVLTGSVPFAADSIEDAVRAASADAPPPAGRFEPSLPPQVDDVLAAALRPDPYERPGSVGEVADALLDLLGDPAAGREGLAELVDELVAEEELDAAGSLARLGLWDRLAVRSGVAASATAAAASAYLAWAGLESLHFGWAPTLAAVAIAAAGGWFAPPLGLAAGLVLVAAGGFSISPWLGALAGVIGAVWWAAIGRTRAAAGVVPAFAPPAAVLGMGGALPLLAGFFIDGVWAAAAGGAAGGAVLALVRAGALASGRWDAAAIVAAPLTAIARAPWPATSLPLAVTALAWGLAAASTAVGVRRGTRLGAAAGALGGLLAVACGSSPYVTGGSRWDPQSLIQIALASILIAVVIVLGPPLPADAGDADE